MTSITVTSENVKRDLMLVIKNSLPTGDVYITDGTSVPYIVMRSFKNDLKPDYTLSVTEARAAWCNIKFAIYAYQTTFAIAYRGIPVAFLTNSDIPHPMQNYKPLSKGEQ